MAVSSVSYVATRTSGNLADCSQEHVIVNILKARPLQPDVRLLSFRDICRTPALGLKMRLHGPREGVEV